MLLLGCVQVADTYCVCTICCCGVRGSRFHIWQLLFGMLCETYQGMSWQHRDQPLVLPSQMPCAMSLPIQLAPGGQSVRQHARLLISDFQHARLVRPCLLCRVHC